MNLAALNEIAEKMVTPGKGILAADESTGTIKKRFDKIALESSFESRRAYRELLFTAPEAEKHISGVILYDETIRQQTASGQPFPQLVRVQVGSVRLEPESLRLERYRAAARKGINNRGGVPIAGLHDLRTSLRKEAFVADVLPNDEALEDSVKSLSLSALGCPTTMGA